MGNTFLSFKALYVIWSWFKWQRICDDISYCMKQDICLTLYDETASVMGLNVWLLCVCESLHTTHTGCLSSRQKSLSVSLCKLQISSDPDERLSFLSFRSDSHKSFNTRLHGGSSLGDLLLQIGHSWVSLILQNCWRHSLQTLWLHERTTGSLKISQHTGQEKYSSESESIFTVGPFWGQQSKLYFHFLMV